MFSSRPYEYLHQTEIDIYSRHGYLESSIRASSLHWEDVTHAFNIDTHGLFNQSVDGTCKTMVNGFGAHQFCFNQRRTQEMMDEIRQFIKNR